VSRTFRLAGLLRLRALAEDRAAVRLAEATREREGAEARRQSTEDTLGGAHLPGSMDASAMRAVVASRLALSGLLTEHAQNVVAAQEVVQQADAAWAEARSRTRTLEKLQERHEEAERVDELRAEQAVLDEIAGRRVPVAAGTTPAVPATTSPEEVR
jgi:flagellar protein FliJ